MNNSNLVDYRNVKKVDADGYIWDSKKERNFYLGLKMMKGSGEIKDFEVKPRIELQPHFSCQGKTIRAITIIPDFKVEYKSGRFEFIDTKGFKTETWKLKWKMLMYKFRENYKYTIV